MIEDGTGWVGLAPNTPVVRGFDQPFPDANARLDSRSLGQKEDFDRTINLFSSKLQPPAFIFPWHIFVSGREKIQESSCPQIALQVRIASQKNMQFRNVTLLDSHRIFQFRSLGLVSFQGFLQGSQVILGLFGIKGNRILGDFPDLPQVNQLVIGPVLEDWINFFSLNQRFVLLSKLQSKLGGKDCVQTLRLDHASLRRLLPCF